VFIKTGYPEKWSSISRELGTRRPTSPVSRLHGQVKWVSKHYGVFQE